MAIQNHEDDKSKGLALLRLICGAPLSSVQFVMDYLILGFDAKGSLTTLVWPELVDADRVLKVEMNGYKDGLCALITKVVEDADVNEDEMIIIKFQNKKRLCIPLRNYKLKGEKAIFTAPKHHLYVWR